jgi:DNA mismatch repair ATPase MutS
MDDAGADEYDGVYAAWHGAVAADGTRVTGFAVLRPRARASKSDPVSKQLTLFQVLDTDRYGFLESLLTSEVPNSLYVPDGVLAAPEQQKLEAAVAQADVVLSRVPRTAFSDADAVARLEKLSGGPCAQVEGMAHALKAAACLIARGGLVADPVAAAGTVEVRAGALSSHLRLDAAAVRALNIFPSARDAAAVQMAASDLAAAGLDGAGAGAGSSSSSSSAGGSSGGGLLAAAAAAASRGRITSLLELLGHACKTKAGRRTLRSWLVQPLADAAAITARQDLVASFVESPALRDGWRTGVAVPDLDAIAARLAKARAGLPDLVRMYSFATALPAIVERLKEYDGPESYREALMDGYVEPLAALATEFGALRGLVEAVVEDPTAADYPRVKRSWSDKLRELGEAVDDAEEACVEAYDKLVG